MVSARPAPPGAPPSRTAQRADRRPAAPTATPGDAPTVGTASRLARPDGLLKGIFGVALAVALWEALRAVGFLPASIVPPTWTIVGALVDGIASGELVRPLGSTALVWVYGLAATTAVAVPLGLLVGLSRWADAATGLLFDVLRPVPAVAFVPVAVVLLGLGAGMQVPLIVFAAMWPLLYNTRYGVRNVDPNLVDSGRSVGLSRAAVVRRVVLPSALPAVATGLRLSASIALVVTIVTELVASATGLGQYISLSQQAGQYADSLAGVLLAGLFGTAINAGAVLLERRALSWHHGMNKARD